MTPARDAFVGRLDALSELGALARSPALVTVTGPGGVGKTRLMLEWLGGRGETDARRAALVRLDGLSGEGAVLGAVAAAVACRRPVAGLIERRSSAGCATPSWCWFSTIASMWPRTPPR
ncbi:hypothetical protein NS226_05380 [Aureimonas ureilytica]|uniref:Orc1-like AAA ATPase domain-containing protein n=1 Tax=Aureimonas ureilytica TaxID=401562 RepID=A0A175RDX0_9HYPH|nr:hypothetical protein [Aureimonas ureilytica]KTQ97152.1 hypothetical protein NS226_05380 [Aureimonas ureilytica]